MFRNTVEYNGKKISEEEKEKILNELNELEIKSSIIGKVIEKQEKLIVLK